MERTTRKEQATETREKLLEAAKTLFAERGYDGTPVREINKQIGKGDGILYHYFPGGKREILSVLLQESMVRRKYELQIATQSIEELKLRDALLTFSRRFYEVFMADIDILRIMVRVSDLLDLEQQEEFSDMIKKQTELFAQFLRRREQKGEIRTLNYIMATRQFIAMIMQILITELGIVKIQWEEDTETYLEQIVDYTFELWRKP
ncbi:AcrR family transcriptional regulator [Paenibacillus castaneae]|uniref:TetR/AcrR family transcriptional regulator n=1 Tax=Paenibacillus castaneae TaxID=474957 RepID=UPI00141BD60B|nr:TetR/AcrR family transcriptional regulator [Paenibacillus castaneae]NIK79220.1 AcrR family transcriptional regulator [Paenibacillus castaneae]